MRYISTRDSARQASAAQAIVRGISADGGLFVPEYFPEVSLAQIDSMCKMTYPERAAFILGMYLTDFDGDELLSMAKAAYARFDTPDTAPVHTLPGRDSVLELWHGPTCAFKDVALQLLPRLMSAAKRVLGDSSETVILTATSGDTGKAALEGFADVPGARCIVFYPEHGVSRAQKLQMTTQRGDNVSVFAVDGNFDDAQRGVKRIFTDPDIIAELRAQGKELSSANSINFGRLAPQIVYYFSSYCDLVNAGAIMPGSELVYAVPTGNFGDILAGVYAKWMGLPIKKLVCASNRNRVLDDFIRTGAYDAKREFYATSSPSMDILVSSNLERLLFDASGRDDASVREWMEQLRENGRYEVNEATLLSLRDILASGWASDAAAADAIKATFDKYHYLIDPHTAVAVTVLGDYRRATGDDTPAVIVSTASPYKFGKDVLRALKPAAVRDDDFECVAALHELSGLDVPPQIAELPSLPVLHNERVAADGMERAVLKGAAR